MMRPLFPALTVCLLLISSLARPVAAETRFRESGGSYAVEAAGYRAEVAAGRLVYRGSSSAQPDLIYALEAVRLGHDRVTPSARPAVVASANVVCCYHGDVFSESYTATDAGVEQCWVINRKPASTGEIVIQGRMRSPHRAETARGLRFVDARGRTRLTYGEVTAIDSARRVYKCAPKLVGEQLTITIPRWFVETAAFPILIDPVVGPETTLGMSYGPAPAAQENVDVTVGQNGYFAVWQDSRGGSDLDIFGCRISPTGEVLDRQAIAISAASGNQSDPAVAWNGKQYLVVWMDRRAALPHIYCARVQPDGEVLDKQGILLSGTSGTHAYPDIASDGTGWLVVWQQQITASSDIYGCKMNGDGSVTRTYSIASGGGDEDQPSVAWNGSCFIVVWRDNRNQASLGTDIYGGRVARNGVRLPGESLVSADASGTTGALGDQANPQICAFGSTSMVVWDDTRTGTPKVYGCRLSSAAAMLDPGGIAIPDPTGAQQTPSVGYDGSKLLVTWRTSDLLVRGSRLDTAGKVLDANGRSVSTSKANSSGISCVGADTRFLVAWSNLSPGSSDVLSTTVSDGGDVTTPAGSTVSQALDDQTDFAVADNGSEYAVVWAQPVNGYSHIRGVRLSHDGTLLSAQPVGITYAYTGSHSQPSIAWNGTNYLLTWAMDSGAGSDIKACRLRTDLTPVDAAPITVCSATEDQQRPCAVVCGTSFLVVWEDFRNAVSPNYYNDLYGAIVSSTGTVSALSSAVSLGTGNQEHPKAASSGSGYMVVWEDNRNGYPLIKGTRVTTAGTVQDSSGISFPATSYVQTGPSICFGGASYFVAWSDWYAIAGCRVGTDGVVQDTAGIAISGGATKYNPGVCWDGSQYRLVWEDYRSGYSGNSDIYCNTVSASGVLSTDPEAALISDLVPQLKPWILMTNGSGLLLYSRLVNFANCTCAATLTDQEMQELPSVGAAKHLAPGSLVALRGKVVTGAFSGYFYIEEPDRSSGIKVISTVAVSQGDIVDAVGTVTVCDGERQINASMLSAMGVAGDPPKPLYVRGDCLGGGPLNGYTPGISGAVGCNNVGLLVTTTGKVTTSDTGYFYIESRSALPIKVKCGTLQKPTAGKLVSVTGICTCDVGAGSIGRAILPRAQGDILVLN